MHAIMRLLSLLADMVLPPRETDSLVRKLTFERLSQELSPVCRGDGLQAVISLFPYDHPMVEACITEAKFEGSVRAAELLGSALYEYLHEVTAEAALFNTEPPLIVPLPLSTTRHKERGYNQVERIVRAACTDALLAEVDATLLVRTRETRPQTSLSGRLRQQNVADAFRASCPCDPHRTYIVVDDVVTTGHTMLAACTAMRAAGAIHLLPLTLAY